MAGRRVAVTGVGILSSCGNGVDAFWEGLNAPPREGERRVEGFDPESVFDNPKEARRADRVTQLALAAATEALAQAGEIEGDPLRRGVLIAHHGADRRVAGPAANRHRQRGLHVRYLPASASVAASRGARTPRVP